MESFGNSPPALGKRTEGPAQEAGGVGRVGKEAQLRKDINIKESLLLGITRIQGMDGWGGVRGARRIYPCFFHKYLLSKISCCFFCRFLSLLSSDIIKIKKHFHRHNRPKVLTPYLEEIFQLE